MEDLIALYKDIIENHIITFEEKDTYTYWEITIYFKDNSRLEYKDKFVKLVKKRRYSFQYMRNDNSLIVRWDNAPHPHKVATMPHHKHVDTDENVQPSEEMNLGKVLLYPIIF